MLTIAQLSELLDTPPTVKIAALGPIPPALASHSYLIGGHQTVFPPVAKILISILQPTSDIYISQEPTEDDFHAHWDNMFRDVLSLLSAYTPNILLHFTRNSTDAYTSGTIKNRLRPDFLCWMRGALVLRGEEKRLRSELHEARSELLQKFGEWSSTFYGQMPFVLAYATGGFDIKYAFHF